MLNCYMKHIIGESIKDAILNSSFSDLEIANHLGVTRNSVYIWRTKPNAKIRKSNLISLSDMLNKSIVYDDNIVQFSNKVEVEKDIIFNDTGSITLGDVEMELNAGDLISQLQGIIKDLQADKKDLRERMITLNQDKVYLSEKIDELDKTILRLSDKQDMPLLDMNEMQTLANGKEQIWMDVTPKFAKALGYDRFELVGQSYLNYTTEEMRNTMLEASIQLGYMTEEAQNLNSEIYDGEWVFVHKDGREITFTTQTKVLNNHCCINQVKVKK